jgi:hypothetical protein
MANAKDASACTLAKEWVLSFLNGYRSSNVSGKILSNIMTRQMDI